MQKIMLIEVYSTKVHNIEYDSLVYCTQNYRPQRYPHSSGAYSGVGGDAYQLHGLITSIFPKKAARDWRNFDLWVLRSVTSPWCKNLNSFVTILVISNIIILCDPGILQVCSWFCEKFWIILLKISFVGKEYLHVERCIDQGVHWLHHDNKQIEWSISM